ncbi:putative pectinesterase/pectinesterase inhibitor 28 [Vitis vinifera]|uniref:Putative pectinesterase/pectinesterase inhibitor 28 n=1 Tax=Vitis vinifera TaxID=29760 RepID=A0A438BNL1_VITVI|nr:putative pectinesterase/pectinesterase inhibitor 28 [Vitis vinifera]
MAADISRLLLQLSAAYPKNLKGRYVIYVKAGIYREYITVTKDQVNVYMYGDGPRKTIVTGTKSYRDGITTYKTATFSAIGKGFVARSMGFVQQPQVLTGTRLLLSASNQICQQSSTAEWTELLDHSKKAKDNQQNTVTAHGKAEKRETTGLVIHNCRIVPEQKLFPDRFKIPSFLGRSMEAVLKDDYNGDDLGRFSSNQPGGMPWAGDFALNTLFYAEYGNRGPGAKHPQQG